MNKNNQQNIQQNHTFFLTHDLQIGYYKNLQDINTAKIYSHEQKNFIDISNKTNPYKNSYSPDPKDVQVIINALELQKYSLVIPNEELEWYKEVDSLYSTNRNELLKQTEIVYCYLILKAILIGFPEKIAIGFSRNIINKYKNNPLKLQTTINRFQEIMDNKILWIPNTFEEDCVNEEHLFQEIIDKRLKDGFEFNFTNSFGRKYLDCCNNSYLHQTYLYNSTENYFNKNKYSLEEQEDLLWEIHDYYSEKILINLLSSNPATKKYLIDKSFINRFLEDIRASMLLSMRAWEVKNN